MHPIIAKIGPLYVYSYGLMVATGFAIAMFLAYRQANEFGVDKDKIVDLGITILLGGIFGARLLYVLTNLRYYILHPLEVMNLARGGLVWYGAFLFGILAGIVFVRKNKINFWVGSDLLAPYIPLAQSIGRIGCFLNGCCYGGEVPANFMFGVVFPSESIFRHPTQIYSSLILLLLFVILRAWQRRRRFNGEIFLAYIILYSLTRFCMEFLRGDNPKIFSALTMSQLISIPIFIACLSLFIYRFIRLRNK